MKRTYCYFIQGREHSWSIEVELKPAHAQEMIADGVELGELHYKIPDWVVYGGLSKIWMFITDIFHFRNPFAP